MVHSAAIPAKVMEAKPGASIWNVIDELLALRSLHEDDDTLFIIEFNEVFVPIYEGDESGEIVNRYHKLKRATKGLWR